eukprot:TRINITY_DN2144_c0_g1_i3.p1 TRINITY_DN2144_c0_g1~~TRINITY_DN2144_c0_g1_i3.p1  ORF type:complete len:204 (-),score=14.85 TRINITY_DN2144_c0_g1_i3:107-718(-)
MSVFFKTSGSGDEIPVLSAEPGNLQSSENSENMSEYSVTDVIENPPPECLGDILLIENVSLDTPTCGHTESEGGSDLNSAIIECCICGSCSAVQHDVQANIFTARGSLTFQETLGVNAYVIAPRGYDIRVNSCAPIDRKIDCEEIDSLLSCAQLCNSNSECRGINFSPTRSDCCLSNNTNIEECPQPYHFFIRDNFSEDDAFS